MLTTCDFQFVCPMKWDEMADLADGSGKYFAHCQRSVVTVHTRKEFKAAAKRGDCVAVFPEGVEKLPPMKPNFVGEIDPRYFARAPKKRRGKVE